jgi:hypothetical protein
LSFRGIYISGAEIYHDSAAAAAYEAKLKLEKEFSCGDVVGLKAAVVAYADAGFRLQSTLTFGRKALEVADAASPEEIMKYLQEAKVREMARYNSADAFRRFHAFLHRFRADPAGRPQLMRQMGASLSPEAAWRVEHMPELMKVAFRSKAIECMEYACRVSRTTNVKACPTIAAEPASAATFSDATKTAGLDGVKGGGLAVGDFNNDGWEDLLAGRTLWQNRNGHFTKTSLVPGGRGGKPMWGDLDNDGFRDIVVCGRNGLRLLRNVKGRSFEDRTPESVFRPYQSSTQGNALVDVDNDGLLDLYVSCYEPPKKLNVGVPDHFYRNAGGFEFADETKKRGFAGPRYVGRAVCPADFDNDGDMDVYVANYRSHPNLLFLNDGKGFFKEVSAAYGATGFPFPVMSVNYYGMSTGCCWGDLDNDGDLDLVTPNLLHPRNIPRTDFSRIYSNTGKEGGWKLGAGAGSGIQFVETSADVSMADIDNDGDLDLFFTAYYKGCPHHLYRNDGGMKFSRISWKAGVVTFNGTAHAWFDYDRDGDMDLVVSDNGRTRLFRNRLSGKSGAGGRAWIQIELAGTTFNRSAIGARVSVTAGEKKYVREISGVRGMTSQDSPVRHIGLGSHTGTVDVEIRWQPGVVQNVKGLTTNKRHRILQAGGKEPAA